MTCGHQGSPAALFQLPPIALERLREGFARQIRAGFAQDGLTVAALPAWLPLPAPGLRGRALVVDIGGTNVRAALVELGSELSVVAGPLTAPVIGVGDASVGAEAFFDVQAELVRRLDPEPGLPLGYCFSYPARVQACGDAELLRWTKDIRVAGVVGQRVGALLRQALERRGVLVGSLRVLNDTVAALLAAAMQPDAGDFEHFVGLVVGTGSNMATFVPRVQLSKLPGRASAAPMAVNLESGNMEPVESIGWDLELDASSDNPGRQAFEKAVSGRYLPRLFAIAAGDPSAADPEIGAGELVRIRQDGPPDRAALAAGVLDRSAVMVACGLAAVLDCLPPGRCLVAAEGGLFWGAPGYAERVEVALAELPGGAVRLSLRSIADANLAGAAAAALGPGWQQDSAEPPRES